ncbi:hypothetical protein DUI87_03433 [Hirundo rustica rustica]|uniref:Uncharacterized protein n=1 Tax=Hirundo rustica rustica TaxID=333673 RepID=A0A3M0LL60_HIRRU|nr:hypothetical protein DUI87_03433 [Hirundo rustica rustica]
MMQRSIARTRVQKLNDLGLISLHGCALTLSTKSAAKKKEKRREEKRREEKRREEKRREEKRREKRREEKRREEKREEEILMQPQSCQGAEILAHLH